MSGRNDHRFLAGSNTSADLRPPPPPLSPPATYRRFPITHAPKQCRRRSMSGARCHRLLRAL
uniref:Uncharacterized protein n=1 Tax=Arundo donax TaxID=35708 RepID=A0A0A9E5X2_ARUDO